MARPIFTEAQQRIFEADFEKEMRMVRDLIRKTEVKRGGKLSWFECSEMLSDLFSWSQKHIDAVLAEIGVVER